MQSSKVWDDYWQYQTTSNSFASEYGDGDGPYSVVSKTWLEAFSSIGAEDTIVDLGSGSGALLNLLITQSPATKFHRWINVDYANVKPLANAGANVEWQKANFTRLDIEDGMVDRVFSMFGFEYADPKKASLELLRVLKTDGEAALMCHHPDSIITKQSKISIAAHRTISSDKIFKLPKKVQSGDIAMIRRHSLNRLMYQLDHSPKEQADDIKLIGNKIHQALHASEQPQQVTSYLQQVEQNLRLYSERLSQQVASTQSFDKIRRFLENQSACNVTSDELTFQDVPIAYLLNLKKQ